MNTKSGSTLKTFSCEQRAGYAAAVAVDAAVAAAAFAVAVAVVVV